MEQAADTQLSKRDQTDSHESLEARAPLSSMSLPLRYELEKGLRIKGDFRIGVSLDYNGVEVRIPAADGSVLSKHTCVVSVEAAERAGTLALLVAEARARDYSVIILDVTGTYGRIAVPSCDPGTLALLKKRGIRNTGIPSSTNYHLASHISRDPDSNGFGIQFACLSPDIVEEALGLSKSQAKLFQFAYNTTKKSLYENRDSALDMAGRSIESERDPLRYGCTGLTLCRLLDVVRWFIGKASGIITKSDFFDARFIKSSRRVLRGAVRRWPGRTAKWRRLYARLWDLKRSGAFAGEHSDLGKVQSLQYGSLMQKGRVSVLDISPLNSLQLKSLLLLHILQRLQEEHNRLRKEASQGDRAYPRTLVVIEEAHEFLPKYYANRMPRLSGQLEDVVEWGRSAAFGLVFSTGFPQFLPLRLIQRIDNYIIHAANSSLTGDFKEVFSKIEERYWRRVTQLNRGEALIAFPHMARPLFVAIDPPPCTLDFKHSTLET